MAEASTDPSLSWCADRLLVPGNPLTLTRPYAPPERRDALLALRTVITEIALVPGEVSDPDVARRKLGWWRQALEESLPHPALQALQATGASERIDRSVLADLIDAVESTIDRPRFETVAEFEAHAESLAAPGARAEGRLMGAESLDSSTSKALIGLAAGGYRIRMVRDLVLDARQGRWNVPLELQAEFQVTRQQVETGEHPHRTRALIAWMAGQAVTGMKAAEDSIEPEAAWRHRHAVLYSALDARLGRHLVRRPGRAMDQRMTAVGPRAAFFLWRQARKLRRFA